MSILPTLRLMAVAFACLTAPTYLLAASLDSCEAIRGYFAKPLPEDSFRTKEDLKSAVDFLKTSSADCEIYGIEAVYWNFADALDRYSQTFRNDGEAKNYWAAQAISAYRSYLDWFWNLDSKEQDGLIRSLTRSNGLSLSEFKTIRRRWLLTRIGNVLNSMGACFERIGDTSRLIESYENFVSDCSDVDAACIQGFSEEVVRKWHKWLRAIPGFPSERSDAQIKDFLEKNDDAMASWNAFRIFLDKFIQANPSVRVVWTRVRLRIDRWLV